MGDSTAKKKPSKKNKPKSKTSQLDGDSSSVPAFSSVIPRGESPLLRQNGMNNQEEDNYRRLLEEIDSAAVGGGGVGCLKIMKGTEEKKQMKKKSEEIKDINIPNSGNGERSKVEDKKKKERKLSKKIDEKDKPQMKRKTEEKITFTMENNTNFIRQEFKQQTQDGQIYYFQQRQQGSYQPEWVPLQNQQFYKQENETNISEMQLERQLQFELHQKKLEQQARKLESSIRRAEEESRRLRDEEKKRKEDEKIQLEIVKLSEELKDWQFELMSEKSILSVTNGLSSITKQLSNTSKLKDLKVDKLQREREKQYSLLQNMQKVSEQFLAAVMMSNKKLDVTQCAITPYIKWIYKTLGKKEKHHKKIDQEVLGEQSGNHRNNNLSQNGCNNNNTSGSQQLNNDENNMNKQENTQQWLGLLTAINESAGKEKVEKLRQENAQLQKIKGIGGGGGGNGSNGNGVGGNSNNNNNGNNGSIGNSLQSLKEQYEAENKRLKTQLGIEQNKQKQLQGRQIESEQIECKLRERNDKQQQIISQLEKQDNELMKALSTVNTQVLGNIDKSKELKENIDRLTLEIRSFSRQAERVLLKKQKNIKHVKKNLLDASKIVDDKDYDCQQLENLLKDILSDPYAGYQQLKNKPSFLVGISSNNQNNGMSYGGYSSNQIGQQQLCFDYHLVSNLPSDTFDTQSLIDTHNFLNDIYPIASCPNIPDYALKGDNKYQGQQQQQLQQNLQKITKNNKHQQLYQMHSQSQSLSNPITPNNKLYNKKNYTYLTKNNLNHNNNQGSNGVLRSNSSQVGGKSKFEVEQQQQQQPSGQRITSEIAGGLVMKKGTQMNLDQVGLGNELQEQKSYDNMSQEVKSKSINNDLINLEDNTKDEDNSFIKRHSLEIQSNCLGTDQLIGREDIDNSLGLQQIQFRQISISKPIQKSDYSPVLLNNNPQSLILQQQSFLPRIGGNSLACDGSSTANRRFSPTRISSTIEQQDFENISQTRNQDIFINKNLKRPQTKSPVLSSKSQLQQQQQQQQYTSSVPRHSSKPPSRNLRSERAFQNIDRSCLLLNDDQNKNNNFNYQEFISQTDLDRSCNQTKGGINSNDSDDQTRFVLMKNQVLLQQLQIQQQQRLKDVRQLRSLYSMPSTTTTTTTTTQENKSVGNNVSNLKNNLQQNSMIISSPNDIALHKQLQNKYLRYAQADAFHRNKAVSSPGNQQQQQFSKVQQQQQQHYSPKSQLSQPRQGLMIQSQDDIANELSKTEILQQYSDMPLSEIQYANSEMLIENNNYNRQKQQQQQMQLKQQVYQGFNNGQIKLPFKNQPRGSRSTSNQEENNTSAVSQFSQNYGDDNDNY